MLNSKEQFEQPQPSPSAAYVTPDGVAATETAATARVTAEEFSAAILALEQRKADEARRMSNTVEVGKTIQDLNIDATPDDVMREVLAQRAARSGPRLAGVPAHSQLTDTEAATRDQLRSAAVMLRDYYDKNISPSRVQVGVPMAARQSWRERRGQRGQGAQWGFAIGMIAVMSIVMSNVPGVKHGFEHLFDDSPATYTQLSHLADGQTVYVTTSGLDTVLANGGAIASGDGSVVASSKKSDNTWTLFKSGGKLYLSGFTLPKSINDLKAGPVRIYSQGDGGELEGQEDQTVVVPLQGVANDGVQFNSDWSEVTLDHIQPDANTRISDQQT